MDGLQIAHLKTLQIPLRSLDTGMAEDLGQVEQIAASSEVGDSKSVP